MSFQSNLTEIFSGSSSNAANRWIACNYNDKVLFAHNSVIPQYWPGYGNTLPIPGLDNNQRYIGVAAFYGHVMLWFSNILKYSDTNDFTNFIPVGETAVAIRLTLTDGFVQPIIGVTTDWIYVNEIPTGLVELAFVRIEIPPQYNFYTVRAVLPFNSVSGTGVNFPQTINAGITGLIWTTEWVEWAAGGRISFTNNSTPVLVNSSSDNVNFFNSLAADFITPATGDTAQITVNDPISVGQPGDYISIGDQMTPGLDIYQIILIDNNNALITVKKVGQGTNLAISYLAGTGLRSQHWINVTNDTANQMFGAANEGIRERYAVKLSLENLTGQTTPGTTIPGGLQMSALVANEAGQLTNIGDRINGDILQFIQLGEYGYILKNRSIQSVQNVGRSNGTFFIRPEITDEGFVGKYSFVKIGDDRLYFLGNRDFYEYKGGNSLNPLLFNHVEQVFKELDLTKRDLIFGYHNEAKYEIWMVYPVIADTGIPRRVIIYNYKFDSITVDDYDAALNGLTAVGGVDWTIDLFVENLLGNVEALVGNVEDLGNSFTERLNIIAFEGTDTPITAVQGRVYSRDGVAYLCDFISTAIDFGDDSVWKYVYCVKPNINIKQKLTPSPFRLYCQVGARDNFDSDTRWSDPLYIDVAGNSNDVTKFDITNSGRFIFIRFYSEQADIQYEISGYTIFARKGADY